MSITITATADIPAPPQAVWKVLTDFAAYGEWNPFRDRVEGDRRSAASSANP